MEMIQKGLDKIFAAFGLKKVEQRVGGPERIPKRKDGVFGMSGFRFVDFSIHSSVFPIHIGIGIGIEEGMVQSGIENAAFGRVFFFNNDFGEFFFPCLRSG